MRSYNKRISTSILAPLFIFTVFTTCLLVVLLSGADIYKKYTDLDRQSFDNRILSQYLAAKVRQSDFENGIAVGRFAESTQTNIGDTLYTYYKVNSELYYTRIYCHNGYLCELFTDVNSEFEPSDGARLMPAESVDFVLDNGILTACITQIDGQKQYIILDIRSGKEVIQ